MAESQHHLSSPRPHTQWYRDTARLLGRTFRYSIDPRQLLLAAVGVLATTAGWWLLGELFRGGPGVAEQADQLTRWPWQPVEPLAVPGAWSAGVGDSAELLLDRPLGPAETDWLAQNPLLAVWLTLSRPFRDVLAAQASLSSVALAVFCGLWALAVWALIGGTISRLAAVRLAREERIAMGQAFEHARARWSSHFWAPLFPLCVGVVLPALIMSLASWLLRFDLGTALLALIWPLYLLAGLMMAVVALGLWVGWPLMWAAISVEGTDAFDAIARALSYVRDGALRYLGCALVATAFGLICWIPVAALAAGVVYLSHWGASWTAGSARMAEVAQYSGRLGVLAWPQAEVDPRFAESLEQLDDSAASTSILRVAPDNAAAAGGDAEVERTASVAADGALVAATAVDRAAREPRGGLGPGLIGLWMALVTLVAVGFQYSFFWTVMAAIYLALREHVDATPIDEIFMEDEPATYGLPPLERDEAGVPLAADEMGDENGDETGNQSEREEETSAAGATSASESDATFAQEATGDDDSPRADAKPSSASTSG